jgi:hypothetical protein
MNGTTAQFPDLQKRKNPHYWRVSFGFVAADITSRSLYEFTQFPRKVNAYICLRQN